MEFDVVIVGGGPAVLSTSIKLMQISQEKGLHLNICLIYKASEIGAHRLSGAVIVILGRLIHFCPIWKLKMPSLPFYEEPARLIPENKMVILE